MLPVAKSRVFGSVVRGRLTVDPFQGLTDGPVLVVPAGGAMELVSSKTIEALDVPGVLTPLMAAVALAMKVVAVKRNANAARRDARGIEMFTLPLSCLPPCS